MMKQTFLASLLLFSLLLSALGQQQTPEMQQQGASQERGGDEVVRITTNLVQVDAVVTKNGKQVTDLRAEDFEILEDGKPQVITNFSYISNTSPASTAAKSPVATTATRPDGVRPPVLPARINLSEVRRTVALVVDDLGLSFMSMGKMKGLLRRFVDEQVQPGDLVAIIRTSGDVGALQQFTSDKRLLYSAIEHLRWNICSRGGLSPVPSVQGGGFAENLFKCGGDFSTLATLRALRFIVQGMRRLPGRKSMVILSDSIPVEPRSLEARRPGSSIGGQAQADDSARRAASPQQGEPAGNSGIGNYVEPLRSLGELAIRASVVIYAIDARGVVYTGFTAADDFSGVSWEERDNLMKTRDARVRHANEGSMMLTRQTGGLLIQGTNDLESGLGRVMEDQQGYYLIGYRPGGETFNRRFHSIKVRLKRQGLAVRTRTGFYGIPEAEARGAQLSNGDRTLEALMSPFGAGDIAVRLTALFADDPARSAFLRSFLHLDARGLSFTDEPGDWHKATFELTGIVFGDNGEIVSRHSQMETLRLHGEAYARALRDGLVYDFNVPVKKHGAYQLRVAVRDVMSSRLGAAGQFVEIPDLGSSQLLLSGILLSGRNDSRGQDGPEATGSSYIAAGPGVRRFRQQSNLFLAYVVYNAQKDKADGLPHLTEQVRIFSDGRLIFTGPATQIVPAGRTEPGRIPVSSRLQLGADLRPGPYVLQIVVNDNLAGQKRRIAEQAIDFEIVE